VRDKRAREIARTANKDTERVPEETERERDIYIYIYGGEV